MSHVSNIDTLQVNAIVNRIKDLNVVVRLSSQDIFQRQVEESYKNCRGAVGIAADWQVFGSDQTHDYNLHALVEHTRSTCSKF